MFSNLHRSHKTAVDSSYPICPTVRQWQCGAAKFDGKLFLTLDNNILLSRQCSRTAAAPVTEATPAGGGYQLHLGAGVGTTGVSSGDLNGGRFVSIM